MVDEESRDHRLDELESAFSKLNLDKESRKMVRGLSCMYEKAFRLERYMGRWNCLPERWVDATCFSGVLN